MRRSPGEGTAFYSDAKSCWIWRIPVGTKADGKVQYKSGRAKSRAEAINKMKLAAVKQEQPKRATTVAQYAEIWLAERAQKVRPATVCGIKTALGHIIPHIGQCKIEAVNRNTVEQLRGKLDQTQKGMVYLTIAKFLAMCNHAKRHGYNIHDLSGASCKEYSSPDVEVFSSDEIRRLISTDGPARPLCCIASGTGMRMGEVLALRWTDFRADFKQVTISRTKSEPSENKIGPPKTKNGYRTIGLPNYLIKQLKKDYKSAKSDWLFPSPLWPDVRPINYTVMYTRYQNQCKLAGVKYRRFHTFRHTHASELLQAGIPLAEVARRLGDTITTVVATYSHWIRPDERTPTVINDLYS